MVHNEVFVETICESKQFSLDSLFNIQYIALLRQYSIIWDINGILCLPDVIRLGIVIVVKNP